MAGAVDSEAWTDVAAQEWRSYVTPLLSLGEDTVDLVTNPEIGLHREEMYRFLFSTISVAYLGGFYGDADHPIFWPQFNQHYAFASANADTVYSSAPLHGNGVYRISGTRGTTRLLDFQIGGEGFYPRGELKLPPTYDCYDADELTIGRDGVFSFILSAGRPDGYSGDWRKLDPRSTNVLMRQVAYDWVGEIDGRIAIERLDKPVSKPRRAMEELQGNHRMISSWSRNWTRAIVGRVKNAYSAQGLVNKVGVHDNADIGGYTTQLYVEGLFDIADDEALIYETEMPATGRYWGIAVNDMLWDGLDYTTHQTNLNGHTAKVDSDGIFRGVISVRDPGVPNWLDTVGNLKGFISGRLKECSSYPVPRITKIKLASLRDHLPAETPEIRPDERDAAMRARSRAAQMRRRW